MNTEKDESTSKQIVYDPGAGLVEAQEPSFIRTYETTPVVLVLMIRNRL